MLAHPAHVVLLYGAEWQRKSYEDNGLSARESREKRLMMRILTVLLNQPVDRSNVTTINFIFINQILYLKCIVEKRKLHNKRDHSDRRFLSARLNQNI